MEILAGAGVAILLAAFFVRFYATPFYWRRAATEALKSGRLADAETFYLKALAISPRDFALWRALGQTRRRLGAVDAALDALRKAGELKPNCVEIFAERVEILRSEGRLTEAAAALDWVVETNDAPIEALLTRAAVSLDLRRFEAALADCDRAIDKIGAIGSDGGGKIDKIGKKDEENFARAFCFRGVAELGLKRAADAESDFETAYLLDPKLAEARNSLRDGWTRRGGGNEFND